MLLIQKKDQSCQGRYHLAKSGSQGSSGNAKIAGYDKYIVQSRVDDPGNHGEEESEVRRSGSYQIGLEQSLEHAGRSKAHEDAEVGAAVC